MNVRDHAELPRRSFPHLLRNGVMAVCHHRWSWDHEWAHMAGIPEEELAHIEQMDPEGFERHKWIAISYVRAYVSGKFGNVPKELRREMRNNYTAHEIKEIELVARIMDIGNRGANTWDAMLSRLKGNPAADSHILDEAVLSGA